ncbi:MAG: TonB-dependent receptor [Flavobacteriales bacterium]|nr:TonB-dependent receptor [Flavobacteriales bacterium]MBK9535494.1 TonB-dependent receptor [Flavobacteriales bacterium]MBP9139687.1 TonB-dependent receptor [Flavobacteriales bacterium]HQX31032.1 TonB-dependent receptor [Flavobacteriales bacterium]HQX39510.1 TonB-dependent receptor [Flavobacteriales bacterium]
MKASAQGNTQTVRGKVLDIDSRQPLIGATITIVGSEPLLGVSTDIDGQFAIPQVPTGRIELLIRMLEYDEQRMPDLLVNSAKELVLTIRMEESLTQLKEFAVHGEGNKGEVRNDMATLSARRISVEETSRVAGGINDPARMVSSFAGVAGDATGNNDIIARGNSSKGVLWRLEGIEIPNPNHFSDEGSTGGPINVLNSDMLDNSDFYTGAFAPEYGNALSAIFDMRLRDGNDTEQEYTFKLGVLGTDLTAEGPIPGTKGGSYLANFRYSTLALLDGAGIVDYGGVPKYSDASFKLKLPTAKAGTFSLFGLGGKSHIIDQDQGEGGDTLFSRADYGSRMGVIGLTNTRTLSDNSFVYTTVSLSGNGSSTEYDESDFTGISPLERKHTSDLGKWTVRASTVVNNRLSASHKLRTGVILSSEMFRMGSASFDDDLQRNVTELEGQGASTTLQAFTSWKWRMNEKLTMTSGVHVLHYSLNNATSVEPRLGLKYQFHPGKAISIAGGLHSRTEAIMTYNVQIPGADGKPIRPNEKLGLSKAAHAVLGYEHMFAEDIQMKVEAYYQHHFNVPVENDANSSYSLTNYTGWFTTKPLVNKGVGRNYGLEVSLEKFFTHGYHFMATASLSDTRYKALDGVWRNSRFNMGIVANALAGKEWKLGPVGKDRVLTTGFRYSILGGQYGTPIDLQASLAAGEEVAGGPAWSKKGDPIHKLDLVISYRVGRPRVSHEFKVDVQNVLNGKTNVNQYFNRQDGRIEGNSQLAILPVVQYMLRF